jgi:hypothetical protein
MYAGVYIQLSRKIVTRTSGFQAILVIVPDQKRLAEYLKHPIHQKAKRMPCFLWSTE